ncbi:hypothetical protein [Bacillus sp. NPDC094106]|uniref:hypothetical protein n=1 Tax=Bacillus sp. NPDC094106 TaxID=3363949 RepID=UPI0037F6D641
MEKTIVIDGKDVRLKTTAAAGFRYKAQFGRDMFADMFSLQAFMPILNGEISSETDFSKLDFDVIYNLVWVYAKTADNEIPDPMKWLDTFGEFPIYEIVIDIQDLIMKSLKTSKKK